MIFLSRIITLIVLMLGAVGLSYVPSVSRYEYPSQKNQTTHETEGATTTIVKIESGTKSAPKNTGTEKTATSTIPPKTGEAKTNPKQNTETQTTPKVPAPQVVLPASPVSIPPVSQIYPNLNDLNSLVRESVVNIFCTTNFGDALRAITATGVIIDPRGVVLTNAHVGQYYLLRNYAGPNSIDCVIRTGSPAKPAYRGELIFISPKWVEDNKENLKAQEPLGTGENDFALIYINKNIDSTEATSTFPALDTITDDVSIDRSGLIDHVVAGYPASLLGSIEIAKNLYAYSAISRLKQVFTFDETTVDLISVGGNVVAQRGASGGAVVSSLNKKLVGLIVTTTDATTTADRDLRAITLSHIERAMRLETGKSLRGYLSGDLNAVLSNFNATLFPTLSNILRNVLISP